MTTRAISTSLAGEAKPQPARRAGSKALIRYIRQRLLLYLITIVGASTLTFLIFHLMPGNPMAIFLADLERTVGQTQGAQEIIDYYTRVFGLDQPLYIQYFIYLKNLFVAGFDLGPSFMAYPKGARDVVFQQLPWTLGLLICSMLIAWLLGTVFGAVLGWFRQRRWSTLGTAFSVGVYAIPVYFVALGLIILVGYEWRLLPARGPYDPSLQPAWTPEFIASVVQHAILPVISIVLVWGLGWTLGMRSLMVSVLGEDYLVYARAKGLTPISILREYAFRNAMLPQVAALGIALGATLNGVYVIEILFGYPGVGTLFVRAMGVRDYNVMQGIVLFSIFAVLTLGLIVDLILPLLDPRIRLTND